MSDEQTELQKDIAESQVDFLTAMTGAVSLLSKVIESNKQYTYQVESFAKTLIRLEDKVDLIGKNTTPIEKVKEQYPEA